MAKGQKAKPSALTLFPRLGYLDLLGVEQSAAPIMIRGSCIDITNRASTARRFSSHRDRWK